MNDKKKLGICIDSQNTSFLVTVDYSIVVTLFYIALLCIIFCKNHHNLSFQM